jgi:hypothetical protein
MRILPYIFTLLAAASFAATTNTVGHVVLINADGDTRPPQSIATPGQVAEATDRAAVVLTEAQVLQDAASNALAVANHALLRTVLYSTNYVVTSTVYMQSVGGVPYDPSNQIVRCRSIDVSGEGVEIVATLKQAPLVAPVLDWRQSVNGGGWTSLEAVAVEIDVPPGLNDERAYRFTLPKPAGGSAFFRVVDNSTGASGSGLYWLVFGGVFVDGKRGWTGTLTTGGGHTFNVRGGVVVDPDPL